MCPQDCSRPAPVGGPTPQALTGRLLAVANELISARERVGLGEAKPAARPNEAPPAGSIEAAVEQLELYR